MQLSHNSVFHTSVSCHPIDIISQLALVVNSSLVDNPTNQQPAFKLPRRHQWSLLNHFQTKATVSPASERRLATTDNCPCGKWQPMLYIISSWPQTTLEGGLQWLHSADNAVFNGWQHMACECKRQQRQQNGCRLRLQRSAVWHYCIAVTVVSVLLMRRLKTSIFSISFDV